MAVFYSSVPVWPSVNPETEAAKRNAAIIHFILHTHVILLLWHVENVFPVESRSFFRLRNPAASSLRSLDGATLQGRCCSFWSKHHQESNGPFQTTLSLCPSLRERERERGGLWVISITTGSFCVLMWSGTDEYVLNDSLCQAGWRLEHHMFTVCAL